MIATILAGYPGEALKSVLGPYLLARHALLARLAQQIGETPDAHAARLSRA